MNTGRARRGKGVVVDRLAVGVDVVLAVIVMMVVVVDVHVVGVVVMAGRGVLGGGHDGWERKRVMRTWAPASPTDRIHTGSSLPHRHGQRRKPLRRRHS